MAGVHPTDPYPGRRRRAAASPQLSSPTRPDTAGRHTSPRCLSTTEGALPMRRTCSLLFAGLLATVLGVSLASTAQAALPTRSAPAVVPNPIWLPGPGGRGEIFLPFLNPSPSKCLDLPGGTSNDHAGLQLFHCHATAPD